MISIKITGNHIMAIVQGRGSDLFREAVCALLEVSKVVGEDDCEARVGLIRRIAQEAERLALSGGGETDGEETGPVTDEARSIRADWSGARRWRVYSLSESGNPVLVDSFDLREQAQRLADRLTDGYDPLRDRGVRRPEFAIVDGRAAR